MSLVDPILAMLGLVSRITVCACDISREALEKLQKQAERSNNTYHYVFVTSSSEKCLCQSRLVLQVLFYYHHYQ